MFAKSCSWAGFPSLSALVILGASPAQGQEPADTAPAPATDSAVVVPAGSVAQPRWRPKPILLGSEADERVRLDHLIAGRHTGGYLLRTPTHAGEPAAECPRLGAISRPRVSLETSYNGGLPFSMNDGALWAGRGNNGRVRLGTSACQGRVTFHLAPEIVYSENREFDFIPSPRVDRSRYASPWHTAPESMDLPLRFGRRAFGGLAVGESSIRVDAGAVEGGLSTESEWWGPGIRNAITLSSNAPGIPRTFLRTKRPLPVPGGRLEAVWNLGVLVESRYFDFDRSNNLRSWNAAALAYTPSFEPGLTVGLARAVYAPLRSFTSLPAAGLDVLRDVGRPNARPADDSVRVPGRDGFFSVFGRWVMPEDGLEVYGEWSRSQRPGSLRELLVAPQHTQGYTAGLQWARPLGGGALRVQGEATNLEQSSTYRQERVVSFYKSRPVLQGYTHHGKVIGAAIGPGASSQWMAVDFFAPRWRAGLYGGRIRWENDTHYAVRIVPTQWGHDVSLFGGVRLSAEVAGFSAAADLGSQMRYNYLFQYLDAPPHLQAIDVRNRTLRLTVSHGWSGR